MNTHQARIARRTFFLALLLPAAARAVSWNNGNHGGHHVHVPEGNDHGPHYNDPEASISQHDTIAIQDYYKTQTAGAPLPPPSEPRPWAVGQQLPAAAAVEPLPPDLNARLSPFYGFHYVRVGGDIVMLADGTRVVAAGMPILIR
jgi:hypothetical protein